MKQTVLQVVAKTPRWGFDLAREIAIAFDNAGHDVVTIFLNGAYQEQTRLAYPGVTIFPEFNHKKFHWRIMAFLKLYSLCRQHKFDLVISHHYKPSSIMATIDRVISVRRLFMLNHNPGNLRRPWRRRVIHYLFSDRWRFLGVSDWVRRDFLEHASFMNPDRFSVLYNCLDIDAVTKQQRSRESARDKFGMNMDDFIFGNIHRLDPSKGHDYMIKAFASVADQMNNAKLVIIGGGGRKSMLEKIASDLGVGDRVHLTGMIPDASSYATGFDVFISPSLHEGFGLGLLEGMAASLPTITSTGGASPEVVGDTGLQFPPGDSDALAGQMLKIYNMAPQERNIMGESSCKRLKDCFSRETYHRNVINLLSIS